jgi:hypothetical protein
MTTKMPDTITLEQVKDEYEHWENIFNNEQVKENPDLDIIDNATFMMNWLQKFINRFYFNIR